LYVTAVQAFYLCGYLFVEDKDLRSELSAAEEKDAGHKVCRFYCLYLIMGEHLLYRFIIIVIIIIIT